MAFCAELWARRRVAVVNLEVPMQHRDGLTPIQEKRFKAFHTMPTELKEKFHLLDRLAAKEARGVLLIL